MPVGCSRMCPSESTKRRSLLAAMAIPLRPRRRSAHAPCATFDSRDAAARVTATQGRPTMNDYLPFAYRDFRATYPEVANTLDQLGHAADEAGPLDERTRRLVHLGIAI